MHSINVPSHPYYPPEAEILDFSVNNSPVQTLLFSFTGCCLLIFCISFISVKKVRPNVPFSELATVMWFALCGSVHVFFEGYFIYNYKRMASRQDLFGQLWKEYALSDSRYLIQDPMVLCMETVTVLFWGPLCFLVAGMIALQHPLRHPFQIVVSLAHLYGDVLYYATSTFELVTTNKSYSRPEPYYFWGYYVFMNAFWIIVPLILLHDSFTNIGRAFTALSKMERSLQGSGELKKTR